MHIPLQEYYQTKYKSIPNGKITIQITNKRMKIYLNGFVLQFWIKINIFTAKAIDTCADRFVQTVVLCEPIGACIHRTKTGHFTYYKDDYYPAILEPLKS